MSGATADVVPLARKRLRPRTPTLHIYPRFKFVRQLASESNSCDPNMLEENPGQSRGEEPETEADWRREFDAARAAKRFDRMYCLHQHKMVQSALSLCAEEGIQLPRFDGTAKMAGNLCLEVTRAIEERGRATPKLEIAKYALEAVTYLALTQMRDGGKVYPTNERADLLLDAFWFGSVQAMVSFVELGFLNEAMKYLRLRGRQRSAAAKTNKARADVRGQVLAEALAIQWDNPDLPAEEMAVKLLARLALKLKIATVATWIRRWRREGKLANASQFDFSCARPERTRARGSAIQPLSVSRCQTAAQPTRPGR